MESKFNPALFSTAEAGLLQAQAYRNLRKFLSGHLKQYALSMPEWAIMGLLQRHPDGLMPSDVAGRMSVSLPQVTSIANKLHAKQILERVISPTDRRVRTIKLSRKGARFFANTEAKLREEMKLFLSDIQTDELANYIAVLSKIARKY